MNNSRGKEEINEGEAVESNVNTVDYRTPPGEEGKEPKEEGVQVVHLTRKGADSTSGGGGGGGGVLAKAAAAVANTLQSAKDAISRTGRDKTRE